MRRLSLDPLSSSPLFASFSPRVVWRFARVSEGRLSRSRLAEEFRLEHRGFLRNSRKSAASLPSNSASARLAAFVAASGSSPPRSAAAARTPLESIANVYVMTNSPSPRDSPALPMMEHPPISEMTAGNLPEESVLIVAPEPDGGDGVRSRRASHLRASARRLAREILRGDTKLRVASVTSMTSTSDEDITSKSAMATTASSSSSSEMGAPASAKNFLIFARAERVRAIPRNCRWSAILDLATRLATADAEASPRRRGAPPRRLASDNLHHVRVLQRHVEIHRDAVHSRFHHV